MKYTVMHACGHEQEHELFGPGRDRERRIAWLETCDCDECREKAAQARIQAETEERGLPELTGSPKQIAWASSIRIARIQLLEEAVKNKLDDVESTATHIAKLEQEGDPKGRLEKYQARLTARRADADEASRALDYICGICESRWWIDHRDDMASHLIEEYRKVSVAKEEEAVVEEDRQEMVIMEPEEKKTGAVATVEATAKAIILTSDKDDHIRSVVKDNGFSWDYDRRAWTKAITERTGEAKDLLPDTCRLLLEAGIPIKARPEVKEAVEAGSYQPECHRWVSKSTKEEGKLFLDRARGVSFPAGTKTTYNGDGLISANRWREIREFASLNGYRITAKAEAMLRAAEDATVGVKPAAKIHETAQGVKDILNSSRDVLEDLIEED